MTCVGGWVYSVVYKIRKNKLLNQKIKKMKKETIYVAPALELQNVRVEAGFAISGGDIVDPNVSTDYAEFEWQ